VSPSIGIALKLVREGGEDEERAREILRRRRRRQWQGRGRRRRRLIFQTLAMEREL